MIRGIRSRWLLRMRNGQSDCQMAEMVVPTVATRTKEVVLMFNDHRHKNMVRGWWHNGSSLTKKKCFL